MASGLLFRDNSGSLGSTFPENLHIQPHIITIQAVPADASRGFPRSRFCLGILPNRGCSGGHIPCGCLLDVAIISSLSSQSARHC